MRPSLFLLLLSSSLLSSALISLLYTLFFSSSTLSLIVVSLLCYNILITVIITTCKKLIIIIITTTTTENHYPSCIKHRDQDENGPIQHSFRPVQRCRLFVYHRQHNNVVSVLTQQLHNPLVCQRVAGGVTTKKGLEKDEGDGRE